MTHRPKLPSFGVALVALGAIFAASAGAQTLSNGSFGGFSKSSSNPIDIESDVLVVHDSKKYATFKGNVKAVQGTTTLRANELDVHYVGGGDAALTGGASQADPQPQANAAPAGGTQQDPQPQASATPAAAKSLAGGPAPGGGAQQADPTSQTDAKPDAPKSGGAAGLGGSGAQISQIEARGNVIIESDKDQTTTSDWALYDVPTQIVTVGGNVVLMQGKNVLKGDQLVIDLKTGESRFENKGDTVSGGRIRALFMPKDKDADAKTDGKTDDAKSTDGKSADAKSTDAKSTDADAKSPDAKSDSDKGQVKGKAAEKAVKQEAKSDAPESEPEPQSKTGSNGFDPFDSGQ